MRLLDRVIDISKYVPLVVKNTKNFEEISNTENMELNLVNEELNTVFSSVILFLVIELIV